MLYKIELKFELKSIRKVNISVYFSYKDIIKISNES